MNCRVVVVTFGNVDLASKWKNETNCIYPVVSDVTRSLYSYYNLTSSVRHTWDIRAQTWYGEQLCQGRKLHPMADNDDPHQLGGNVIIDNEHKVQMIYRSKFPLDRPTVNEMLNVVTYLSSDNKIS